MRRRDMLTGGASAALLGRMNVEARAQTARSDPAAMPEGMDLMQSVMSRHDFTILADYNHDIAPATYGLLADPAFIAAETAAKVGSNAIEVGCALQWAADGYRNSTLGRNQFLTALSDDGVPVPFQPPYQAQWFDSIARVIDTSRPSKNDPGRKIVFSDDFPLPASPGGNLLRGFWSRHRRELDRAPVSDPKAIEEFRDKFIDRHAAEMSDLGIALRIARGSGDENRRIAAIIMGEADPAKRTVVMIGAGHAQTLEAAFQAAGKSAIIVGVHASRSAYEENIRNNAYEAPMAAQSSWLHFLQDTRRFASDPPLAPAPRAIAQPKARRTP